MRGHCLPSAQDRRQRVTVLEWQVDAAPWASHLQSRSQGGGRHEAGAELAQSGPFRCVCSRHRGEIPSLGCNDEASKANQRNPPQRATAQTLTDPTRRALYDELAGFSSESINPFLDDRYPQDRVRHRVAARSRHE